MRALFFIVLFLISNSLFAESSFELIYKDRKIDHHYKAVEGELSLMVDGKIVKSKLTRGQVRSYRSDLNRYLWQILYKLPKPKKCSIYATIVIDSDKAVVCQEHIDIVGRVQEILISLSKAIKSSTK